MLVQDALKGSGAISRFHRMNIVLVRQTPDGKKLRLPVKYDVTRQQVVDTNNYAMHAGDWLEVTEGHVDDRWTACSSPPCEPLRPMMRDTAGLSVAVSTQSATRQRVWNSQTIRTSNSALSRR